MSVQIKHVNGEVHLVKDGGNILKPGVEKTLDGLYTTDKFILFRELHLSEEEAILFLGKEHLVVKECRNFNATEKRKKIEQMEHDLKKLKESL